MPAREEDLLIPSVQPGIKIVGILQRKSIEASTSSQRQPIALILHGLLAHKNQCYHRALADALPIDSLRFDFRGNGDSHGDWTLGSLDNDVTDLATVVRHLHHRLGYKIELIVAHSRGSMVSWMYLSRGPELLRADMGSAGIPKLAVVSGRWFMDGVLETYARFQEGFKKEGFYRWKFTSAGKKREHIVYPKDLEQMAAIKEPRDYVARVSPDTQVIILHGTADQIVPERDAHTYLAALDSNPARTPGSHQLHLIQGADHMYRGATQPVVERICSCVHVSAFDSVTPSLAGERGMEKLRIDGKNVGDLVDRIQTLSLEYQQASGSAVDDDALMAILINQAVPIPEYHLVVKELTESGRLTDYYTLASALQNRWKQIR